jgi:hypothetical protein
MPLPSAARLSLKQCLTEQSLQTSCQFYLDLHVAVLRPLLYEVIYES